jgi:hypothetical protein
MASYDDWKNRLWTVTSSGRDQTTGLPHLIPHIAAGNRLKFEGSASAPTITNESTGTRWGSGGSYDDTLDWLKDVSYNGTTYTIKRAGTSPAATLDCHGPAFTAVTVWTATEGG